MKKVSKGPYPLVTQHNYLIKASYKMGIMESRIFTLILSYIHKHDKEIDVITVPMSRILGDNISGRSYSLVKEACVKLKKKEISILPVNSDKDDYDEISIFDRIRFVKGEGAVKAWFGESIKPYLIDLIGEFTTLEIEQLLKLKNANSHRMYWFVMSIRKMRHQQKYTVDEFRKMLLGDDKKYPTFGEFKKHILKPALEEIYTLENGDGTPHIEFELEELKESKGKAVTHLRFAFKRKYYEELDKLEPEKKQLAAQTPVDLSVQTPVEAKLSLSLSDEEQNCYNRLLKLKLSDIQAKNILKKVTFKEIHKTCYSLELWYTDNRDKNIGAYAYKSFKEQFSL
jgi:plasmid replication initiation protein